MERIGMNDIEGKAVRETVTERGREGVRALGILTTDRAIRNDR